MLKTKLNLLAVILLSVFTAASIAAVMPDTPPPINRISAEIFGIDNSCLINWPETGSWRLKYEINLIHLTIFHNDDRKTSGLIAKWIGRILREGRIDGS